MSTRDDVINAAKSFDPQAVQGLIGEAEHERQETVTRYPIDAWDSLSIDDYAQGQAEHPDNLCHWMEHQTPNMGSMRGGSAHKLIIYRRKDGDWHFPTMYENVEEAWEEVRDAFVDAFTLASQEQWQDIDGLAALQSGPGLLSKLLYAYFPSDVLPITSGDKLAHFLRLLDRADLAADQSLGRVAKNRALLAELRSLGPGAEWTTKEWERFLFRKFSPFEGRLVKIAPGENAQFWDECLENGYICVGWDEVGDLADFQSKQDFLETFSSTFDYAPNKASEKANELWTLLDLDEGERIVANKGTSEILAIGTVVSPGYRWRQDRETMQHTVAVEWDTSWATEISPPFPHWAFKTVKELKGGERERILSTGGSQPAPGAPTPTPQTLERLIEELDRKRQVILYGPPGTGKTRVAMQLAEWWGEHRAGSASGQGAAPPTVENRAWVAVASPTKLQWDWEDLEGDGKTEFQSGRVKSNYGAIKVGDLVFGYTATPAKRIKAIARVAEIGEKDGARTFSVAPVSSVGPGLDWAAIKADEVLLGSQLVTNGAQGTLFALNTAESARLLELLGEVDGEAAAAVEAEFDGIGPTQTAAALVEWLTFHPAYAYEDFVEGFRPKLEGSGMELTLEDGVFKRISLQALASPGIDFLLIIDEINRANVASVFGELITLIESDKREAITVRLPYSKELFQVPKNLFIVGTMNTADRSIRLLDTALRRRFGFVELMPDPTLLEGLSVEGLQLDMFLTRLNDHIARFHGRDKQVGHSYLLKGGQPITEASEFARAFWRELLPLLQEYAYEDYATLADMLGEDIIDREARAIRPEVESDPSQLIAALVDRFQSTSPEAE